MKVVFQFDGSCVDEMISLVVSICLSQGCGSPAVNQNWSLVVELKRQMTVNSLGQ